MDNNTNLNSQSNEIKKKETFGVVQPKKNNTRKNVALGVVAGFMLATAIAVPIVIKVNQNKGYTVDIEYNLQGQLNGSKSVILKKGSKVGDIAPQQMNGYVFVGYCSDSNCTQQLDAETEITKDLTVYLHYVAINYSFANIPEGVSITTSKGEVTTSTKLNYGDEITVTYIIPVGHSVGNFKLTGVELISQQADVTEDNGDISRTATYKVVGNGTSVQSVVLTAEFETVINQYTVTLIGHNKTEKVKVTQGDKLQNITNPASYEDENNVYYFVGWNKNYNASATDVMEDLSTVEITGDITFYAIYTSQTKICDVIYQNEATEHVTIYKLVNNTFIPLEVTEVIHAGDTIKVEYTLTDGYELNTFTVTSLEEQQTGVNYVIGTAKLGKTITIDFVERQQATEGLQFTENGDVLAVSGYVGANNEVVIPMQYEGRDVVTIADSAFKNNTKIKSVKIPESVTSIGNSAFYNCTALARIAIPESVTSIGNSAFYNCTALASIAIPESVTSIGNSTFYNCTGLVSIAIPEGVISIGNSAFDNCKWLSNVILREGLKEIGNRVFYRCTSLTKITIPSSVTSIGTSAFEGCTDIMGMNYLGTLSQWCEINFGNIYSNPTYYTKKLVIQGEVINDIFIPDSITSIRDYAFYNCQDITKIIISESIINIGNYAFYGCTGITNISIPEELTNLGSYAFGNCTGLTEIYFNAKECVDLASTPNTFYNAGIDGDGITVMFGENVTKIPSRLFYVNSSSYAPKITSVIIGENVTSIGGYAFYGCSGLISLIIPNNVATIGGYAFSNCTGLNTITIPESVVTIGCNAFSNCTGLTQINYNSNATTEGWIFSGSGSGTDGIHVIIGDNVTTIPNGMFSTYYNGAYSGNVAKIVNITIGKGVTRIGDFAFYSCNDLTRVIIPNNVISIGISAFASCKCLTSVTIGEGVVTLGSNAFNGCSGLTEINFKAMECDDLINSSSYTGGVFYDAGTNGDGITLIFGEAVTKIPANLFRLCGSGTHYPKITDIIISSSVTSIGDYAFISCTGLASIVIPDSVTSIGSSAFSGCTRLTSITIGEGVSSIGSYAFNNCGKLTSVIIESEYAYKYSTSTSACGYLLNKATTVKVLKTVVDKEGNANSYLNGTTFTKIEDGDYYVYTKK